MTKKKVQKVSSIKDALYAHHPAPVTQNISKGGGYYKKFQDPKWQKKRLKIMERDNFKCRGCKNTSNLPLSVHHLTYFKDRDPWDYPSGLLVTLCEDCHRYVRGIDYKILVTEHLAEFGIDKALKWFMDDPVGRIIHMSAFSADSLYNIHEFYIGVTKYNL